MARARATAAATPAAAAAAAAQWSSLTTATQLPQPPHVLGLQRPWTAAGATKERTHQCQLHHSANVTTATTAAAGFIGTRGRWHGSSFARQLHFIRRVWLRPGASGAAALCWQAWRDLVVQGPCSSCTWIAAPPLVVCIWQQQLRQWLSAQQCRGQCSVHRTGPTVHCTTYRNS